jgi:hypothetical protein
MRSKDLESAHTPQPAVKPTSLALSLPAQDAPSKCPVGRYGGVRLTTRRWALVQIAGRSWDERGPDRKNSGSQQTPCRREPDSNLRSRLSGSALFETMFTPCNRSGARYAANGTSMTATDRCTRTNGVSGFAMASSVLSLADRLTELHRGCGTEPPLDMLMTLQAHRDRPPPGR